MILGSYKNSKRKNLSNSFIYACKKPTINIAMDKDKFEKLLEQCQVETVLHKKWLGSEADAFIEVKHLVTSCKDCHREVNRAPIRTHKVVMKDTWMTYCKDCGNYLNPETDRYEGRRDYSQTYRKLQKQLRNNKVDNQKPDDSKE
jgi:hypothetical protein